MSNRRHLHPDRRGIAALEFALVAPLLLLMFGGATGLGFMVWTRGVLANAVSQGAYYAFQEAQTGLSNVSQDTVESLVQNTSTLSDVTPGMVSPPGCTASSILGIGTCCVSTSSPVTLTAPPAPTGTPPVSTCSDGTAPGTYTTISATYALIPILSDFTGFGTTTIQESVTVRLQ